MNSFITIYKGPAKDCKKALENLSTFNKTIQEASNNNVITKLLKSKFNHREDYAVVEYEYDETAQQILNSLEDEHGLH